MFLSVFDVFKIGIGPSSSHTMGPMTAAGLFLDMLRAADGKPAAAVRVSLHGSLAFTGKGHATDRAVALGLLGFTPAELDVDEAEQRLAELSEAAATEGRNLMPVIVDAVRDGVTLGEVCDAWRRVWGTWREQPVF